MVTTVTDNSPQSINTSLFSLEKITDEKLNELKTIKYADFRWDGKMTYVNQQVQIPLSSFGSEVTPSNVLNFMVIYWTGFQAFANADWADSSGLACALTCLKTGTGYARIRCVYFV